MTIAGWLGSKLLQQLDRDGGLRLIVDDLEVHRRTANPAAFVRQRFERGESGRFILTEVRRRSGQREDDVDRVRFGLRRGWTGSEGGQRAQRDNGEETMHEASPPSGGRWPTG